MQSKIGKSKILSILANMQKNYHSENFIAENWTTSLFAHMRFYFFLNTNF